MQIIFFSNDLLFSSRVEGAASAAGHVVTATSSIDRLIEGAAESDTQLILVDLSTPNIDIKDLVAKTRQGESQAKIVAYGPHVLEPVLAAARDAGCDAVLTRGQFDSQLPAIIGQFSQPT